jgi:hypothetical protein
MVCAGRLSGLPSALLGKSFAVIDTRSTGKGGDLGSMHCSAVPIAFGAIRGKKSALGEAPFEECRPAPADSSNPVWGPQSRSTDRRRFVRVDHFRLADHSDGVRTECGRSAIAASGSVAPSLKRRASVPLRCQGIRTSTTTDSLPNEGKSSVILSNSCSRRTFLRLCDELGSPTFP